MRQTFKLIISLTVGATMMLALPAVAYADVKPESSADLCRGCGGTWERTTCMRSGEQSLPQSFCSITTILLFIIVSISVIVIIVGGIRYVLSSGDQTAVTNAKNTILYAVIGLVVAFMAYAIVNFVTGQF